MAVEVAKLIDGNWVFQSDLDREKAREATIKAALITAASAPLVIPAIAYGATGETFNTLYQISLRAVDAGIVFILGFGAVAWMLGNRAKAFEVFAYSAAGYLVYRGAIHIRDFLRALVPDTGVL